MKKALIIVESPTKIKTLKKFLGSNYSFESSLGHIRDLPAKKFGIDVDNDFEPQYEILEGKKTVQEYFDMFLHTYETYKIMHPETDIELLTLPNTVKLQN